MNLHGVAFLLTTLVSIASKLPTIAAQTSCFTGIGYPYRGTVAMTTSRKTCQSWSAQTPQKHDRTAGNYPCKGLEQNYCRNPDNEKMPWCYTTDSKTRWEYCNIPRCDYTPAELTCATENGTNYRGTVAVTTSGKACQPWTAQSPHKHDRTPQNYPCQGLEQNYCRNPDNEKIPWCYTMDSKTRWEYCDLNTCNNTPKPEELTCVTGAGSSYRGTVVTTDSGKTCQQWSSQSPQQHDRTPENYPNKGLEQNYCRNPDNEKMPWCYTTDPEIRWEYCNIPVCEGPPQPGKLNTCFTGTGSAYRGTVATTDSGKACQQWSAQSPHKHDRTPNNYPNRGLYQNYCRNPDNEMKPWCYTTDPETRWEYCKVSRCEGDTEPEELTCFTGNGQAYTGTIAMTTTGKACQSWTSQSPHEHDRTAEKYPTKCLEENYCRNPDNEKMPWCYTTDPETRWEFCTVPKCEKRTQAAEIACSTGDGRAYRGVVAVTTSGKACQSWSAQSPQKHNRTPDNFPDKCLEENYCRNPDNEKMPWCYTTDSNTRWEYCDIPKC